MLVLDLAKCNTSYSNPAATQAQSVVGRKRNVLTPYAKSSLQALIQHVYLWEHAVLMLSPVFIPVIAPSS